MHVELPRDKNSEVKVPFFVFLSFFILFYFYLFIDKHFFRSFPLFPSVQTAQLFCRASSRFVVLHVRLRGFFSMNDQQVAWLSTNRVRIIEGRIPVENIVDDLVTQNVFNTNQDDYQLIAVEPTTAGKTRALLDALPGKSQASFTIFVDTLKKYCPQVLERCSARPRPPKTRLGQLQELLTASLKSKTTMRGPTPWLGSKGKLHTHTFSLDLVIADRDDLAKSMTERSSTTATEQTRRDDHYARPRARKTIPFHSLFLLMNPSQQRTDPVQATGRATPTSGQTLAAAAQTSSSTGPDVVVSKRQEASTGTQSLCTHPKTAVWAGAGCGKTGSCQHVAMLHSEGQLWPFFEALLLWRLREPAVQSATSLVQLLTILLPDEPESKLQEFADDIRAREGRGILAVLDGVDEFVERNNSYVSRLLTGDVLTEACLLATSRPCDAARNFFQSASSVFDANVELLGFSEQQVDSFIDESLGSELAPKLKELLDKSPSLASLMSVPLLAVLVSQVFESSPDLSLSTRTRLYSALMLLVLRHAVNENRIELSDVEKVRLKAAKDARQLRVGVAKKLVTDHAKVAWSAHKKNKAIFDTDFIVDEGEWESLGPLTVGLLDCYISAGGDLTEVRQYSFQHLTMQEYLSAFYLAETMSDDDALQATLTSLCKDTHSYVVLQFLAGLLEKKHHSVFFSHLNQWLHDPHLRDDDVRRERLRVCLLCAQEACGGDVDSFPDQLKLPETVDLYHVTATDMTILTAAVKNSSTINDFRLDFDEVREESDSASVSRVKRQTRSAMTSLATAVSKHPSLRRVVVIGPKYSLLEGKSLANLVVNNRLDRLRVWNCGIGDTEVSEFSSELQHTTLTSLDLSGNMISDAGMYALADTLQHNRTVQRLHLYRNRHSEEAASRLRQQLAHIKDLIV